MRAGTRYARVQRAVVWSVAAERYPLGELAPDFEVRMIARSLHTHDLWQLAAAGALGLIVPQTSSAQRSSIRDSAGVQIVTSNAPSWTLRSQLRLEATPRLVIGTQDGEPYQLTRVAGASILADGRVIIADGASLQLRIFDSRGTFTKAVAGRGGGPGELQGMQSLLRFSGDTLAVVSTPGEVVYYDGNGAFLWKVNHRAPPPVDLRPGFPIVLAAFADGATVVGSVTNPAPRTRGERWIHTFPVLFVDRNKATLRSLGELPLGVTVMSDRPTQPWFAPPLSIANDDETFYVGLGTEYEIRAYARDGRLARLIRRRWAPVRVTDAEIDTYVVEWGKRWIKETGAEAERRRADLRDDPYEKTIPAFSRFLVDRMGRLWVRAPNVADAPRAGQLNTTPLVASTWSVFERNGVWLGDVTLPAEFQPFEIGTDYVVGVARDADGVETVVVYRLRTAS